MYFWPNPSITKRVKAFDLKEFRSKRPKGISDQEWSRLRSEELLSKQVALNCVPKLSKAAGGPKRADKE